MGGKFLFKRQNDGTIDKTKVVCNICQAELIYYRSLSLSYHFNAKHLTESSSRLEGCQPTLHDFSRKITRPVREKVTNTWLSLHKYELLGLSLFENTALCVVLCLLFKL